MLAFLYPIYTRSQKWGVIGPDSLGCPVPARDDLVITTPV